MHFLTVVSQKRVNGKVGKPSPTKLSELSSQTLILNNNESILNKLNERIRVSAERLEWNFQ